jgi:medium-chain acyl-[acyl-carrier-protein] hydrolase
MPISKNFTSILTKDWEINFLQCYPNGFLKYTELCNLFQLTAATHAELGGISFSDMQKFDQAWVLSKMRVEIKQLPKWKDTITIKTWINSLENSRSTRCLELYLGDEKIVGCETFWAVFNTKTRRPEPLALPHDHFEKYPDRKATDKTHTRITIPAAMDFVAEHQVLLSDLDIVNPLILHQKIASFEMNYLKEVALGDCVSILKKDAIFSVEREGKMCFALDE